MDTFRNFSKFSAKSEISETSENTDESSDDSSSSEDHDYSLSTIQACASVAILEEAIDQLVVLGFLGNLPNTEADLSYKSPAVRFGNKAAELQIFDLETIEPYEVALHKEKFVKFQKDRSFVEKVLRETIKNLIKDSTYENLIKYLHQYNLQLHEERMLLRNASLNKTRIDELKALIEKERRESLHSIQTLSKTIGYLKDKVEDLIFENKIKTSYIENWENSRNEQNNHALDKQEEYYINIISQKKNDIEREVRIDAEIEAYIIETQREYQEAIQMWMEQYDKCIEERDTEIQLLKAKREDQFSQLQALSKLYDEHKQQIEDYLAVKEKRRQEAELLAKRIRAATKIQAWWRGTMVRRGFGEFRKKPKKGKDEKKKGKK